MEGKSLFFLAHMSSAWLRSQQKIPETNDFFAPGEITAVGKKATPSLRTPEFKGWEKNPLHINAKTRMG